MGTGARTVARRWDALTMAKKRPSWPAVRDFLSYAGGFLGMAYEVVARRGHPDYGFIPAFLGMMGLPQFLKNREERDDDDDAPGG